MDHELTFPAFLHSLATDVGNGLLIPKGIFRAVSITLRYQAGVY